ALERREEPAEHEVTPAHRAGALDREQIVNAPYDAQEPRVALRILADCTDHGRLAGRDLGDISAALARTKLVVQRAELGSELLRDDRIRSEKVQDVALRGLLADAGQAREERHELSNLRALSHRLHPGDLHPARDLVDLGLHRLLGLLERGVDRRARA